MTSFRWFVAAGLVLNGWCQSASLAVSYRGAHTFTAEERAAIERVASLAAHDARLLLTDLPPSFRLFVDTGQRVIPETGENGSASVPSGVYWTVDPAHPGGIVGIVNNMLRATMFHELAHMARQIRQRPQDALIDRAIDEGLANVFERESGLHSAPWAAYPPNVSEWTEEFLALPADASKEQWMNRHPDGRRWIGRKVGTSLVERAMRATGRTVGELIPLPTSEIVEAALRVP